MLRLRLPPDLVQLVSHLPPPVKRKIRAGLDCLLEDPANGKPLRFELAGLWSFRVGPYRILYRASGTVLEIAAIGPRNRIYQEIAEKLAKLKKGAAGD